MIGFPFLRVRLREDLRRAAAGGDAQQARRTGTRRKYNAVVRSPACAAWSSFDVADGHRRSAVDGDLLQAESIEKTDPVAVRRNERTLDADDSGQCRRVKPVKRAHVKLLRCARLAQDIDDVMTIGRDRQVRIRRRC